jgi:hypothetical protein
VKARNLYESSFLLSTLAVAAAAPAAARAALLLISGSFCSCRAFCASSASSFAAALYFARAALVLGLFAKAGLPLLHLEALSDEVAGPLLRAVQVGEPGSFWLLLLAAALVRPTLLPWPLRTAASAAGRRTGSLSYWQLL